MSLYSPARHACHAFGSAVTASLAALRRSACRRFASASGGGCLDAWSRTWNTGTMIVSPRSIEFFSRKL
jgi:hypothetical protein